MVKQLHYPNEHVCCALLAMLEAKIIRNIAMPHLEKFLWKAEAERRDEAISTFMKALLLYVVSES